MRLRHFTTGISLVLMALTAEPAWSKGLDPDTVNQASFSKEAAKSKPLIMKLQLLLDRAVSRRA
jgi:hypothetical protein